MLKEGDYVSRYSYNNDIVFVIVKIEENNYILKGANERLVADAPIEDLKKEEGRGKEFEARKPSLEEREDYFYMPGKILHIDADLDYLNRCLKYYKEASIWATGKCINENEIKFKIKDLITEYSPNIVVITGHDAYNKQKNIYKNSKNFVEAVREARNYEKSHEKLIIIAGACQSDYEELIKAGANFASSPKRINIHALDPAIIATNISMSDATKEINLKEILEHTKYGSDGIGGIITKGTMYMGYPR